MSVVNYDDSDVILINIVLSKNINTLNSIMCAMVVCKDTCDLSVVQFARMESLLSSILRQKHLLVIDPLEDGSVVSVIRG